MAGWHNIPLDIHPFLTYKRLTLLLFTYPSYHRPGPVVVHNEFDPANAGEISKSLDFQPHSIGEAQTGTLSQPGDVAAARNYFSQAGGGQNALPDLRIDGPAGTGAEAAAGNGFDLQSFTGTPGSGGEAIGAKAMAGMGRAMPGLESALPGMDGGLMPGLEQGALAGMPPGAEPISPMIQMILKMPGLTGIIGSFFDALMSFLFPADGGLLNLLNPTFWADAAQTAIGNFAMLIGNNIPFTLSIFGAHNPLLQTAFQNGFMDLGKTFSAANPVSISFEHQPIDAFQSMNVGGMNAPGKGLYEMGSLDNANFANGVNVSMDPNKFIAMEGGNSFAPSMGGGQVPTATMTQTSTNLSTQSYAPPQATQAPMAQQAPSGGSSDGGYFSRGGNGQFESGPVTNDRGSLLDQSAQPADATVPDGTDVAQNAAPQNYTVQHGDNLWNIAKENLGSGTRWTEIYDLNKSIIGDNPDLIFSGTDLKMPGMENIAGGTHDYVVQSGDNLWNIARDHMGGGQNWHAIYDQNASVIGSNPNLIHPGQHFAMPDGAGNAHMQLAQNPTGNAVNSAGPVTHHTPTTHMSHGAAHHAPAHHAPTAHQAPPHMAHHNVPHGADKVAHATPTHNVASAAHQNSTAGNTTLNKPAVGSTDLAGLDQAATNALPDAGETMELGKTASITADALKQEIGLKAVAKSL